MAKGRSKAPSDPLGSIFNFIFTNNNKPAKGAKPFKVSGVDSQDALTQGLATIAAQPWAHVNDQLLARFDDTLLGAKLMSVAPTSKNPNATVDIKVKDLGKVFKNPTDFVDNLFDQAEKESAWSAMGAGTTAMDMALAAIWAKKNGFSSREALRFAYAANEDQYEQFKLDRDNRTGQVVGEAGVSGAKDVIGEDAHIMFAENVALKAVAGTPQDHKKLSEDVYKALRSTARTRKARYLGDFNIAFNARDYEDFVMRKSLYGGQREILRRYLDGDPTLNANQIRAAQRNQLKVQAEFAKFPQYEANGRDVIDSLRSKGYSAAQITAITRSIGESVRDLNEIMAFEPIYANVPDAKVYRNMLIPQGGDSPFSNVGIGLSSKGYRALLKQNLAYKATSDRFSDTDRERFQKASDALIFWERWRMLNERGIESKHISTLIEKIEGELAVTTDRAYARELKGMLKDVKTVEKRYAYGVDNQSARIPGFLRTERTYYKASRGDEINAPDQYTESDLAKYTAKALQADLRLKIYELQHRGVLSLDETRKLEMYQRQLRASYTLPGITVRNFVGNYGMIRRSLGDLSNGQFIAGIMTGSIFGGPFADSLLTPGSSEKISLNKSYEIVDDGAGGFKIQTEEYESEARKDPKNFSKGPDSKRYLTRVILPRSNVIRGYGALVNLYYFSPVSISKTLLFNGEGFAYLAARRKNRMMQMFFNDRNQGAMLAGILADPALTSRLSMFLKKDSAGNYVGLDRSEVYNNYLAFFSELTNNGMGDLAKKYNSQIAWMNRYAKLANIFSFNERVANTIRWKFVDKYRDKMNKRMIDLLGRFSDNSQWRNALTRFFNLSPTIGLSELIRTGVRVALNALGVTLGGPIGVLITNGLAWVLEKFIYKLARPTLQLTLLSLIGLLGIVCMCMTYISSPLYINRNSSTLMPNPAIEAPVIIDPGDLPGTDPFPGAPTTPPDGNSTCPINKGAGCAQGPFGRWSHYGVAGFPNTFAIDVGTGAGPWRAPTDGTVVTALTSVSCNYAPTIGGLVIFRDSSGVEYRILHSVPLVRPGPVKKGTQIARIWSGPKSRCWSGPHYHLEVKQGGFVNSHQWYNSQPLDCQVQTCAGGMSP